MFNFKISYLSFLIPLGTLRKHNSVDECANQFDTFAPAGGNTTALQEVSPPRHPKESTVPLPCEKRHTKENMRQKETIFAVSRSNV